MQGQEQNPLRMLSVYRMLLLQEFCTRQFRFTKDWLLAVRCVWNGQRWHKNGKRMPHYSLNARMGFEALAAISTIYLLRDLTFDPSSVYFNYIFLFI